MKILTIALLSVTLLVACQKELSSDRTSNNVELLSSSTVSSSAIESGPGIPLFLLLMKPAEGPSRPSQQAIEYVQVTRAYQNLVGTTSGYYYYDLKWPEKKQDYGGTGRTPPRSMLVDVEKDFLKETLNIDAFVNCFNSMADAGAVCSIEIMTDLPVDADPQALFDWSSNSPGHAFLRLTKTSAGKKMVQNIGFYPANSFKTTLTTAPIAGKLVDNANHEFNASMLMSLTPTKFRSVLSSIQFLSKKIKYSIDKYNCTNFAVSVFNSLRTDDPIEPVLVHIPNTMNITGSLTPQALYLELERRKKANGAESANILLPTKKLKFNSGNSYSPCK